MDGRGFDALTATLAEERSRRNFSKLLAGGALGAVTAIMARQTSDAKAKPGKHAPADHGAAKASTHAPSAAAADVAAGSVGSAKHKRRCRSSQTICSRNGQCCPGSSGYVCAWNGNNAGASVCCGVNGARCLGDFDCCGQGLCFFGVCVG
ncbi:MAG TPA: hypothetical protein VFU81_04910 [Thermomicrobiales bacterium]|nr:hypothetical protein [Thermomicrobiales bacterium]